MSIFWSNPIPPRAFRRRTNFYSTSCAKRWKRVCRNRQGSIFSVEIGDHSVDNRNMKKILSLATVLILFGALNAFCGQRIGAKTWSAVQTVDVLALKKNIDSYHGTIVGMRFHFRGKDIRHTKPSWYESAIWQRDPQNKKSFAAVQVIDR